MAKICLTGAGGYIGSVLEPFLIKQGLETVGGLEGIDAVIHLAAIASQTLAEIDPKETWEVNYSWPFKLAKAAKKEGIKRFIFPSGMSIYSNPESTYSLTKYHAECKLMSMADENFKVIIIRPGVVYGDSPNMRYDTIVNNFKLNKKFNLPVKIKNPEAIVPIIEINNLCQIFLKALDKDTTIINAVDQALTVEQIWRSNKL